LVIDTGSGVQLAYQSVLRFLRRSPSVTALFAASDVMAMGAYRAAHELGMRIPQGISIAGFDDVEVAAILRPALATYEQGRPPLGGGRHGDAA
jgi:DNA-binding LacI/PurR family transcriptional regulator